MPMKPPDTQPAPSTLPTASLAPSLGPPLAPSARTAIKPSAIKPYAIGTAARLADIPPETLRIWERRYDLLAPERTEGGHRLYSEDDVALLRAVKRLVDAGLRIGTIARLGPEGIRDEAIRRGLSPPTTTPTPNTPTFAQQASPLIDEIVEAARTLDESRVRALLDRPLLLSSGDEVVTSIYLPLLQRIGDLWHAGAVSIAVEHFVEKMVTARVLAVLQATPQPTSGPLALFVCPPDERHELGLFAAALQLKTGGFVVTILGADLPAVDLEEAVEATKPALLVIAVTNDLSRQAVATLVPVLQHGRASRVPLIVGGASANALAQRLERRDVVIVRRLDEIVAIAQSLTR